MSSFLPTTFRSFIFCNTASDVIRNCAHSFCYAYMNCSAQVIRSQQNITSNQGKRSGQGKRLVQCITIPASSTQKSITQRTEFYQPDIFEYDVASPKRDSKSGQLLKNKALPKTTLRRTARQAKKSWLKQEKEIGPTERDDLDKTVTAFCGAQEYDMMAVARILRFEGVPIDPTGTSLYPEVIHVKMPSDSNRDLFGASLEQKFSAGDAFIFPSGTVVAWNVPESTITTLMMQHLTPAARGAHALEDETIEYREDVSRERSSIKSGVIILGTKGIDEDCRSRSMTDAKSEGDAASVVPKQLKNLVLAQIAFSSGLAKSTKIAVLENQLDGYLEDTQNIPKTLMDGHLSSVTRSYIYQKMGQLLTMRGQLNLSSDLTDAVPDLLWDTEPELCLDVYHERISHELDVEPRIGRLNQRMDYAHEIASILREELGVIREETDERKSTRLEWIIILLIAVEVGFGGWQLYKEHKSYGITKVQVVS